MALPDLIENEALVSLNFGSCQSSGLDVQVSFFVYPVPWYSTSRQLVLPVRTQKDKIHRLRIHLEMLTSELKVSSYLRDSSTAANPPSFCCNTIRAKGET